MYTGPQKLGGGNGRALLYGGITFALVFLLIVGATVAVLVVRNLTPETTEGTTSPPTVSEGSDGTKTSEDTSPTALRTEGERCWSPESTTGNSDNPSGKLRGGGLQFTPPEGFDSRRSSTNHSFVDDVQVASAPIPEADGWVSSFTVGSLHWEDGVKYPGSEVASKQILDCFVSAPVWEGTSGRSLQDEKVEAVTVDGMEGHRATATLVFGTSDIPGTTGTALYVYVIETPEGPSVFAADISVGIAEHEAAVEPTIETLEGVS